MRSGGALLKTITPHLGCGEKLSKSLDVPTPWVRQAISKLPPSRRDIFLGAEIHILIYKHLFIHTCEHCTPKFSAPTSLLSAKLFSQRQTFFPAPNCFLSAKLFSQRRERATYKLSRWSYNYLRGLMML